MANISFSKANTGIAYAARHTSLLSGAQVLSGRSILGQTTTDDKLAAKRQRAGASTVGVAPPTIDISKGYNWPDWNKLMNYWLIPAKQAELKQRSTTSQSWNWYSDYPKKLQFPATFPTQLTAYASLVYPNFLYLSSAPAMSLAAHMLKAWGDFLYDKAATIPQFENSIAAFETAANRIKQDFFRDFGGDLYGLTVGDNYVTPMLVMLRAKATELVEQAQAIQKSAEATANDAGSYYRIALQSLRALMEIANADQALYHWEAIVTRYADEEMRFTTWLSQLANFPAYRNTIASVRRIYVSTLETAKARVMSLQSAKAVEKGVDYGEQTVTSKMRTGTWSKIELDVQSISADQIAGATARMDSLIIQLKPALDMSISDATALYNRVVPSAQAYYDGSSLAVTSNPKFKAKVEEYNNLVLRVEERLGGKAGGPKWGLILGIGAAAAGAFMLAT